MQSQAKVERSQIVALVTSSLRNVLSENGHHDFEQLNEATSLLGHRAVLDSLGLVTLLVDLEQQLDEDYGLSLTLADERALSQKSSPFRTVQSLTNYICLLIEEASESVRA